MYFFVHSRPVLINELYEFQVPAPSMKPSTRRGSAPVRGVPSPVALRPFTPPDLSSIPHMDGTPTPNHSNNHNATSNGTADSQDTGPYIVGSPIDLGNIDNVDNIGIRIGSITRGRRRRTREHIELQESETPESEAPGLFDYLCVMFFFNTKTHNHWIDSLYICCYSR